LPWCSIDDDDSQDIDQLSCCEPSGSGWTVSVAIADVDALVHKGSAIDLQAQRNTTSVYTAARVFPMLPERLSTDLSSLGAHQDRLAIVTAMVVDGEGQVSGFTVCRAQVRNQAKLAYDALAAWLDDSGEMPAAARAAPGMDAQLRLQDAAAQALRQRRTAQGALQFQTFEPRAQVEGEQVVAISQREHNRARQLIEEFMVATNICTAQFLEQHGGLAMRRVVRSPERWSRVVEVAKKYGDSLPAEPDAKALEAFLERRRQADPLRFPDLSLTIVQLMGAGEYVIEDAQPGVPVDRSKTVAIEDYGHFGLAIRDYAHSTAPNRRYPDLISHRLVKAVLAEAPSPYSVAELQALAEHCNRQESAATKVERMQQWFKLSDPAMEEALHDVPAFRDFAGLSHWDEHIPSESSILRFRHLLERHKLADQILATVNALLQAKGLQLKAGTVVDATLIAAPTSTKNEGKARDPEMQPSCTRMCSSSAW
jgi:exoribonuclease-2